MGQQIKENKEKLETATSLSAEIKTLKSENESLKSENEKDKLEKDIEFIAKLSELDEDGIADVVEKEILDKYTTDIQELENQKQMLEAAKTAMENYNAEPVEGEEAIGEKTPVDFEFIKKFNEENKEWTEIETKILAIKLTEPELKGTTDTDEVKTVKYTQKDLETIDDAIKIVEKIIKPVKVQKDLEETLDRMNKALKEMEKLEKESTLTEGKVLQSQKDLGLPTKITEDKITEDKNDEEEKAK